MEIEKRCCICGRLCGGRVHSAYPYKKQGSCCDACNQSYVIPAKLKLDELKRRRNKK